MSVVNTLYYLDGTYVTGHVNEAQMREWGAYHRYGMYRLRAWQASESALLRAAGEARVAYTSAVLVRLRRIREAETSRSRQVWSVRDEYAEYEALLNYLTHVIAYMIEGRPRCDGCDCGPARIAEHARTILLKIGRERKRRTATFRAQ